jgi:hypothetical protein
MTGLTLAIMTLVYAEAIKAWKSLARGLLRLSETMSCSTVTAVRQQHEALGGVKTLDDLDCPLAESLEGLHEFVVNIATVL